MEQTRVYQNQPGNQNPKVQSSTHSIPKTPPESAILQKNPDNPDVKKKTSQNRSNPDDTDQNWIDEDQSLPTHGAPAYPGVEGNGAIWVNKVTEQPGFLFPVARTTTPLTIRRQITEEASLSVTPQVFH